jgi:hypothetical protein
MTRSNGLLSLVLVFSVASSTLAGPACSRKHWKNPDCVESCVSKWGVPGRMMGTDPWGAVMENTKDSEDAWNAIISEACGIRVYANEADK